MLQHISFGVADLQRSAAFYDAVLKPLGYARVMEFDTAVGFGEPSRPMFWLNAVGPTNAPMPVPPGTHLAFGAASRASVDAFHAAALGAGGGDNGPPGLRPHYHANYYAAFVIDPDGHRIEAVCHRPV
ncbi:MAG: VOC family protein [Proteobacteria bacterium]|nr:VOC family protein [Pseudomonadota bacterium]MBI3496470.1 VOC family protein [Pseudomonadota bacterium]